MRRRFSAVGFEWGAAGSIRLTGDTSGKWAFATHVVDGHFLVSEAHRQDAAAAAKEMTRTPSPANQPVLPPSTEPPHRARIIGFPGRRGPTQR
jgi:4'-phosphopantetheinyl transferase